MSIPWLQRNNTQPASRPSPRWPTVLAIVPQVAVLSLGGGNVAWKLFHFLRMLRLLRVKRLAKAVWGAGLAAGPGGP